MTTATLTPFDLAEATQVGRRTFRKQILPVGTINYKGQTINFDRGFLTDLANAFKQGAYDQVPIVFADAKNGHNMDPKRFGGEVKGFELTNDGLDAIVELTEDGTNAVSQNPRLGVSARIVEGLAKADGRTFKRAINHVLLTMDPRVTGMRPWQTVDLSGVEEDEQVVDLTAATYEEDAVGKGKVDKTKQTITTDDGKVLDLAAMSDEEFEALLDFAGTATDEDTDQDGDVEDDTDNDGDTEEGVVFEKDGKRYVVLNGQTFSLNAEGDATGKPAPQGGGSDASGGDSGGGGADLSNDIHDTTTRDQVTQMRIDLAHERWENERKEYARAGVPPFLLDLAAPILSSPDTTVIDLANEDKPFNATETVRKMLNGTKGFIDLHPEAGHQIDLSQEDDDEEAALLKAWEEQYG